MALFENLRSLFSPNVAYVYGGGVGMGVRIADMDAAALYRTQPNLRAAVTFLADNAAQVPLKVHERAGDNDRPRVTDSPAALLLQNPNPDMTPFEFRRWMYSDLLLYERFLMLVVESAETPSGWEMRPVPNSWIHEYRGSSPFAPESVVISSGRGVDVEVPAGKFVLWHGYDPNDPMRQCSRIGALKDTLHEQVESNRFRRQMWRRGGRFNSYLTRPANIEKWTNEAFERFKATWKESWAGSDAADGGGMPILEDGMEIRTVQFNSRDAQWYESVKLAREDVAAVYHFNPALLWPGSGQTYASAKDNARALYNDCLAPTLMFATDRLNHTLLPMVGEPQDDYIVYDITVKTQGTLEERIGALQTACGGPFMSREEVRALIDLPREPDGDLIVPLNVLVGGLASGHDTDPTRERYNAAPVAHVDEHGDVYGLKSDAAVLDVPKAPEPVARKAKGDPSEADEEAMQEVYRAFFERQAKSVLPKIEGKTAPAKANGDPAWWNSERWDRELADDLYEVAIEQATEAGKSAVSKLWPDDPTRSYDGKRTEAFVRSMCERRAEMVNAATLRQLQAALESDDGKAAGVDAKGLKDTVRGVFAFASQHRALTAGLALAAAVVGFGMREACSQNRRRGENVYKTWRTRSGNPRSAHRALNGETVQMDETFSNGMEWPGDMKNGDASQVANCKCVLDVEVREKSDPMRETARSVADRLGLGDDYDPAKVYAAYGACQETIGQEAVEWGALTESQRADAIAEMRTRDREWVAKGKVPHPTFNPRTLEQGKIDEGKAHEIETAKRINKHGMRSDFVVDEVKRIDAKTGIEQTVGLADFADGTEIKTLSDAATFSTIDGYLKNTSGKENAVRVIFDNSRNDAMTDEFLADCIRRSRRFKRGSVYVLTHGERYLKIR